jgi:hypothetical protein
MNKKYKQIEIVLGEAHNLILKISSTSNSIERIPLWGKKETPIAFTKSHSHLRYF